jgi:peptidyl-prolyl cis-trans isomerase C
VRSLTSLLLVAALAVAGCSRSPERTTKTASQLGLQGSAAVKPVPARLPDVVARVNGEAVTRDEFERAVRGLEGRAGAAVPAEQRDLIYRRVLDQLVGAKLLQQEALARRIAVADAEVDAGLDQIRAQFRSPAAFARMLDERKMTLDQLRAATSQDLAAARLIDAEIGATPVVTSRQVEDFYAKNPERFTQAERVRASHILLSVPPGADATVKAGVRAKAEQVLREAEGGKDFAALARRYSQDPGTAPNGGDLGYFQKGQMVGPFSDAAFGLPVGATSGLVETEFGFHIIRVVEKQPARAVPLDEVRSQIEQHLRRVARDDRTVELVKALRAKGTIEILI